MTSDADGLENRQEPAYRDEEPHPFRALCMDAATERCLSIHVIGFRNRMKHTIYLPHGTPYHFLFMFYEPIDIATCRHTCADLSNGLVIVTPDKLISQGKPGQTWTRSWVRFSGALTDALLEESGVPLNQPLHVASQKENERHLLGLLNEIRRPQGLDERCLELRFKLWLNEIRRDNTPHDRPPIPEKILAMRRHLEAHFTQTLLIRDLESTFHASRSWICKAFKKHLGCSPTEYLISLRLSHARELLPDRTLTIHQIARSCGFSDIYYFSRLFKARTGMTPTQYRGKK